MLVDRNQECPLGWLPWLDDTRTIEDERVFISRSLEPFAHNEGLAAGIWFEGALAGGIGFNAISLTNRRAELGYWVSADHQGKGIAARSCCALIDYAFNELKLNSIEIHVEPNNKGTRAIPERLGFTQEGVLRQWAWPYQ